LARSDGSRFGFLRMGETEAFLNLEGKTPLENDRFARWAIRSKKRAGHDLSTEVGTKSRTDVLEGMDDMQMDDTILKSSDAVTGSRSCIVGLMTDGVRRR